MGVHFKDEEWFSRYKENTDGLYEISLVPDKYALGEAEPLSKNIWKEDEEEWVPRRVDLPDGNKRPGLPLDAGHIVQNSESLLNIYNAFFLGKPVTTKFLNVFGSELPLKCFEAPLGASATELLELAGMDVEAGTGQYSVIDGGPYLNEMGIESLGEGDAYVRRTTNGFLVIPKGVASKEYAEIKTKKPDGVISLVGKVSGVSIPLGGRFLKPAIPLISEGDEVSFGQKIGEPVDEGFSIGVWSGMDGTVSSMENEIVQISGGAVSQEGAGGSGIGVGPGREGTFPPMENEIVRISGGAVSQEGAEAEAEAEASR